MTGKNEINGIKIPPRSLQPGQRTEIAVANIRTCERTVTCERADILLEAPNWSLDGESLIVNGDFDLWRLHLADDRLERIETEGVPILNNDHVLDPDGEHVYVSAFDWNIYRVPLTGGSGEQISGDSGVHGLKHFLHGVDPQGERLAFIGIHPAGDNAWGQADVFTMSTRGDDYVQLTHGPGPSDGSEYSPDGEWIYFNTENFDGHAQIGRMRPDGSGVEQLTFDENVHWFPHLSPDGQWACYIVLPRN